VNSDFFDPLSALSLSPSSRIALSKICSQKYSQTYSSIHLSLPRSKSYSEFLLHTAPRKPDRTGLNNRNEISPILINQVLILFNLSYISLGYKLVYTGIKGFAQIHCSFLAKCSVRYTGESWPPFGEQVSPLYPHHLSLLYQLHYHLNYIRYIYTVQKHSEQTQSALDKLGLLSMDFYLIARYRGNILVSHCRVIPQSS